MRDTTSLAFTLDRTQSVVLGAFDSHGHTVESCRAKSFGKGTHHWRWRGVDRDRKRVPDGTYTLRVSTSATVHGATVQGSARATVRVDDRAPSMQSITGNKSVVYPYPDGYRDTFAVRLTLSEPARLHLTIRASHRHLVGTGSASGAAGRTSVTWNGRDTHGHAVKPGSNTRSITATDPAGNHSTSGTRSVVVSGRHLVKRSTTGTVKGADYVAPQVSSACATTSSPTSVYRPGGVVLRPTCSPSVVGPRWRPRSIPSPSRPRGVTARCR